jgi:hypothetical protein
MITDILLRKSYRHLTLEPTGIEFTRTIGSISKKLMRQGLDQKNETVSVVRLIIKMKGGNHRPSLFEVSAKICALKCYADFDTKDFLTLGRNNQGSYLLEIPERAANIRVAERFLEWMDKIMEGRS